MKAHRIIAIAAATVLMLPTYSAVAAESESDYKIIGYLPDWNYRSSASLTSVSLLI